MKGFIIDTDSYSGNFEREMCAYVTGHLGDCEVGDKEAERYLENFKPIPGVAQVENEMVERPVNIYTTPNVWNNGLGFHYKDGQEAEALAAYKDYYADYQQQHIRTVEGHRGKNIPTWTEEAIDKAVKNYRYEIDEVMNKTEAPKYAAYQSVLIYFYELPDAETVDFMKQRAYEYATENGITITGFRTLETVETTEEI